MKYISSFVKYHRKKINLTQKELSLKAGVGLRFIRELEQGKQTLRLDKVNQVLSLFGFNVSTAKTEIDAYEIALKLKNDIRYKYFTKTVKITLKNKIVKYGFIIDEIIDNETNKIAAWKFISTINAIKYQQKKYEKLIEIILHSDIQNIKPE